MSLVDARVALEAAYRNEARRARNRAVRAGPQPPADTMAPGHPAIEPANGTAGSDTDNGEAPEDTEPEDAQ